MALHFRKDIEKLEETQRPAAKTTQELKCKPHKQMFRELGMFNLGKSKICEGKIIVFKYFKGCHKEKGEHLSSLITEGRI